MTTGLTKEQVEERVRNGQVNTVQKKQTKTYGQILRDHLFTLFNLINVILLVCILLSGSYKNALFFLIVIWNFLIGTLQEIRARRTIEKLSLLSAPSATVLRDGTLCQIPIEQIVLGDIMQLKTGCQICADAKVLSGNCQVNESLLTGESTPILKQTGDHLLSGSFLISGQVLAEAEHVGADNYVNQITLNAGAYQKPESVIMKSITMIVRILAIMLIPLAGLQVWHNFFRIPTDFSSDMVRTVASVSSLLPGGLILLVSIVLAVSVVRLSRYHTLVQDFYSIEKLARVDTLLLDKTGTITEGRLTVEDVVLLRESSISEGQSLLSCYMDYSGDDNATAEAIRQYLHAPHESGLSGSHWYVPFSSERKWGLVRHKDRILILGAPECILQNRFQSILKRAAAYQEAGKRVVLLAVSDDLSVTDKQDEAEYELPIDPEPVLLVIIADKVRKTAPETFAYFEQQQVTIKVITGDSPVTASRIAQEAGLPDSERWVDVSRMDPRQEIGEMTEQYTVFGRVSPQQKSDIVTSLQQRGHTVAMVGDGANDVLALKQADCSVAMQSGSDAARCVANLILLNSDFASLPQVVAEGRKSINNLQRSASLYLTKSIYSLILSIFFLLETSLIYPFENIQVTLIGGLTIGIPSFFLALEPNKDRIREHFLYNVLKVAIPGGVMEAAALIVMLFYLNSHGAGQKEVLSTASVYLMLIMGMIVIVYVSGRFRIWKALLIAGLAAAGIALTVFFPGLFSLVPLNGDVWTVIAVISAAFLVAYFLICRVVLPRIK